MCAKEPFDLVRAARRRVHRRPQVVVYLMGVVLLAGTLRLAYGRVFERQAPARRAVPQQVSLPGTARDTIGPSAGAPANVTLPSLSEIERMLQLEAEVERLLAQDTLTGQDSVRLVQIDRQLNEHLP